MSNKLILGTASFGSDYGVKHDGQPSVEEIQKIAQVAWDGGIDTIHTSWEYNLPKICEAIFSEFGRIEKRHSDPDYFSWDGEIGQSLYSIDENRTGAIFIVPVNILDKRFINIEGILIARSVFLQGLLLMDELPQWLPVNAKAKILDFHVFCLKNHLHAYEAALGWVLGLDEIDKVIIGVNSEKQLEQLLQVQPFTWDYDFSITDENVLDPRRWPKE